MKRLVFNVFFSCEGNAKAPNIHGAKIDAYDIYVRNSFVSLLSAKKKCESVEVAIVTNAPLRDDYRALFDRNGIHNYLVPFDRFTVPDSFKWGYAFYKLCALWHLVHRYEFDTYLELDTDTVTVGDLEPMWCDVETTKRVLLFNLHRSINHPVGTVINRDYHKIYTQPMHIDQLGGEYICGTRHALKKFVHQLESVYNEFKKDDFRLLDSSSGDEALVSMAAARLDHETLGYANPYINRFWTGSFYLVSTNWKNDPVLIWHLPAEKKYGMLRLYKKFVCLDKEDLTVDDIAKLCSMPKAVPGLSVAMVSKLISHLR